MIERHDGEATYIDVPPSDTETRVLVRVLSHGTMVTRLGFEAPRAVAITRHDCRKSKEKANV